VCGVTLIPPVSVERDSALPSVSETDESCIADLVAGWLSGTAQPTVASPKRVGGREGNSDGASDRHARLLVCSTAVSRRVSVKHEPSTHRRPCSVLTWDLRLWALRSASLRTQSIGDYIALRRFSIVSLRLVGLTAPRTSHMYSEKRVAPCRRRTEGYGRVDTCSTWFTAPLDPPSRWKDEQCRESVAGEGRRAAHGRVADGAGVASPREGAGAGAGLAR
jgi:hypothetical protein